MTKADRPNRAEELARADRWAARVLVIVGALVGGFIGVLCAPKFQWRLRRLGVDPYALGPALLVIACCACLGAVLAWRAARRR